LQLYWYVALPLQILLNTVLSRYHTNSQAPHDATVGVPLQIYIGLGIISKTSTTFPHNSSSAPHAARRYDFDFTCGAPLLQYFAAATIK
jgi:hypothetical protein